jgi:hypothetical protein
MFPATEKVRAILGEDSPDLIGGTQEYKGAVESVYDTARGILTRKLRPVMGTDTAKAVATAKVESLRKSLSIDIRKEIEVIAGGQKNPALFMLGHGFARSTALSAKSQVIPEGAALVIKDGVGTVQLPKPKKALDGAPDDATDQVNPDETADAKAKAAAKAAHEESTNPAGLINTAMGMVRTATEDKRLGKLSVSDRMTLARLIGQVCFEALTSIGETLPEAEARTVALMAQQSSGVVVARLLPKVAEVAAKK